MELSKETVISVPYNYDEILEILKENAISSGLVSDVDYEGSNIAQFCRILAYAVHSNNMNLTKAINESLLSRTSDYTFAYKIAKQFGYLPKGKLSYIYSINLIPKTQGYYVIPKYSVFKTSNKKYYYMGETIERNFEYYYTGISVDSNLNTINNPPLDPNETYYLKGNDKTIKVNSYTIIDQNTINFELVYDDNPFTDDEMPISCDIITIDDAGNETIIGHLKFLKFANTMIETINIKEGELFKYYDANYNPDGEKDLIRIIQADTNGNPINYLDLNYFDVENDGIDLFVTYFDTDNSIHIMEQWSKRDSFLLDRNSIIQSKTFLPLIREDTKTLRIYFKYAGTGITPRVGSKIYINLLKSTGKDGSLDTSTFEFVSLPKETWTFDNIKLIQTGIDEEELDDIKINAITLNNTANRAVTENDYKAILQTIQGIKYANAFGGEKFIKDEYLGRVFLMFYMNYYKTDFNITNDIFYKRIINEDNFHPVQSEIDNAINIMNNYKIITLQLYYIPNTYIDTFLNIKIKRYIQSIPINTQNKNIFDSLKTYFLETQEKYETILYNSNYIRIIDNLLGDTSGVEFDVKYKISLNKNMIYQDPSYKKYIDFYLINEYTCKNNKFVNNLNNIITDNITITNINGTYSGKIYVQKLFDSTGYQYYISNRYAKMNIRLGYRTDLHTYDDEGNITDNNQDLIIGEAIYDNETKTVLYRFFIDKTHIPEDYFINNSIELEIDKGVDDEIDINVTRNTIFRLNEINFVY